MYWSISKAVKFAQEQTAKAASVKAWRITTKAGRALQEIARQMATGKGYEIATDAQIFAKYGDKLEKMSEYAALQCLHKLGVA